MNGELLFVDTNILLYAYDSSAGAKHDRARALIADLWGSGAGCLSVQVLQEFVVNVTRKVPRPLDVDTVSTIVSDLSRWRVHRPGPQDVLEAIELHRHHGVSFRDAKILRSASALGCTTLYSEDLNDGQRYDGVRVRNPLTWHLSGYGR
ncbi:MAG TPA: PIN domain-containing protein [Natronosporangium sp.]|nr:PIN domain-containing protein [Natronosporangium sp.]